MQAFLQWLPALALAVVTLFAMTSAFQWVVDQVERRTRAIERKLYFEERRTDAYVDYVAAKASQEREK
jgi:hypothetical protein